jgi:3-hydroxyisobutyrate dehydrogenase
MASNIVGLAEGLRYAERAGLDPSRVLDSISAGAAGSQAVKSYGLRMIAGDYAPGFAIKHFAKDLRIIAEEIAAMGLPGVLSETALEVYERCERAGRGELGIHGVIDQLRSEAA